MVGPLLFLALFLMRMDQRRVLVLVRLELAEHAARLVMNHVIVVVGMNDSGMRMRMLLVANDTLAGACLLQRRPPLLAGHGLAVDEPPLLVLPTSLGTAGPGRARIIGRRHRLPKRGRSGSR